VRKSDLLVSQDLLFTNGSVNVCRYAAVLRRFSIRRGSGGGGAFRGGDGVVREIEFLRPVTVSVLTERRVFAPNGAAGGEPGAVGVNTLLTADGRRVNLGGKNTVRVQPGDVLQILTPGGGGFGRRTEEEEEGGVTRK
jgi:5-oxoprolinase (ATP-hydrolysing)